MHTFHSQHEYVCWREREHEEVDQMVEDNLEVVATLKQCGLWKFLHCPLMRAQPRLLNHLVEYWNLDAEAFMIEGQSLAPTTEDIYFLTGLSRRGELVNLDTFPPGPYNIAHYIDMYCEVLHREGGFSSVDTKDREYELESGIVHDWADDRIHCSTSGFSSLDEFCSEVYVAGYI
jgi:hypothetical protein